MDKKGITLYLALVFGIALVIEAIVLPTNLLSMRSLGALGVLLVAVLACVPGIAAYLARKYAPNPEFPPPAHMPPTWTTYLLAALLAPALSVGTYYIIGATGLVKPDWMLGKLMNELRPVMESMGQSIPPMSLGLASAILAIGFVISSLLGATLYALLALGVESGWRGFLMPRLMPLGRVPAYLIAGILWGLWFLPLTVDWFADNGIPGEKVGDAVSLMVRILVMTTLLSIILGETWRRRRNIGLTAVMLGGLTGQLYLGRMSIWIYLFPEAGEPWNGTVGLVSLILWGIAAAIALALPGQGAEASTDVSGRKKVPAAKPEPKPVLAASQAPAQGKVRPAPVAADAAPAVDQDIRQSRPKAKTAVDKDAHQPAATKTKAKSRPKAKPRHKS